MKRCGKCGAIYESVANLARMQQYSASELAPIVVRWPENITVDVRECRRCGGLIACLAATVSG